MRILHFSTSDKIGGSAKSASRIHNGLKNKGICSKMFVCDKSSDDNDVKEVSRNIVIKKFDYFSNKILQKFGIQYGFIPSSINLHNHPWILNADIIQLFNIHGGYFSLNLFDKIAKKKPIVWRLSDLWPITGHCAYPVNCDKWINGCKSCPDLNSYPSIGIDTSNLLWEKKRKLYLSANLSIIAPSTWTRDAAKSSPLLNGKNVHLVHNGIDIDQFKGIERNKARKKLGIFDESRKAILFCAHVAFNNPRKGTDILLDALSRFKNRSDVFFIPVGMNSKKWLNKLPIDVYPIEFNNNIDLIKTTYSACDVVCVPSSTDNLPNTILESMSCGKPIVAINTGGIKDIIINNFNGLLSPPNDPDSLFKNLDFILSNEEWRRKAGFNSRKIIKENFSKDKEISSIIRIYENIIEGKKNF
mgnify:CR=1 FL=1